MANPCTHAGSCRRRAAPIVTPRRRARRRRRDELGRERERAVAVGVLRMYRSMSLSGVAAMVAARRVGDRQRLPRWSTCSGRSGRPAAPSSVVCRLAEAEASADDAAGRSMLELERDVERAASAAVVCVDRRRVDVTEPTVLLERHVEACRPATAPGAGSSCRPCCAGAVTTPRCRPWPCRTCHTPAPMFVFGAGADHVRMYGAPNGSCRRALVRVLTEARRSACRCRCAAPRRPTSCWRGTACRPAVPSARRGRRTASRPTRRATTSRGRRRPTPLL